MEVIELCISTQICCSSAVQRFKSLTLNSQDDHKWCSMSLSISHLCYHDLLIAKAREAFHLLMWKGWGNPQAKSNCCWAWTGLTFLRSMIFFFLKSSVGCITMFPEPEEPTGCPRSQRMIQIKVCTDAGCSPASNQRHRWEKRIKTKSTSSMVTSFLKSHILLF